MVKRLDIVGFSLRFAFFYFFRLYFVFFSCFFVFFHTWEQMDWLSKREIEATDTSGKYTWHHQPSAKVSRYVFGGREYCNLNCYRW